MAEVQFDHKYKCENCGAVLGTHNGEYRLGLLFCKDCLELLNAHNKRDYTGFGVPLVPPPAV